jgi:hypothetical protein
MIINEMRLSKGAKNGAIVHVFVRLFIIRGNNFFEGFCVFNVNFIHSSEAMDAAGLD